MIKVGFAAFAALTAAATAQAAALSPTDIINRHMAFAAKADVDAIIDDYADDAVVLQSGSTLQGKAATRKFFETIFPNIAPGAPLPPVSAIKVSRVWQEGDIGLVTWTLGPVTGNDAFLVKDGKIKVQAVFIAGPPIQPTAQ